MERDSILIEKEMQRYVQRMCKTNENTWKKKEYKLRIYKRKRLSQKQCRDIPIN